MIRVHQAIYGDIKGGYSLLNSSFSRIDTPKRLGNSTDLIDRPPDTTLSSPIIRGFSKYGYFLLIKSFPDHSPGVRKGRIFSHALILEEKDYLNIGDITSLTPYLFDEIDKSAKLQAIDFNPESFPAHSKVITGQVAGAINGTIDHLEYNNAIIWVGEQGYYEWISRIWPNLPDIVKPNIRIGEAYNPKKIDTGFLNLKYVSSQFRANWTKTSFKIVEPSCDETLSSNSAHILAGNTDKSNELRDLISEFSLEINEIDDLRVLETIIPVYQSMDRCDDIKLLLEFAHLISEYNPKPLSAATAKGQFLEFLISRIKTANANEIKVLSGPNWSGFAKAEEKLSTALGEWLNKNLLSQKMAKENYVIVEQAFGKSPSNWWGKTVLIRLASILKQWQKNYATTLWDWWKKAPLLIPKLMPLLSPQAERDLVSCYPSKLKNDLAKPLYEFAMKNNWLHLHGLLALELFKPNEAFSRQLTIDTNESHNKVINAMADKIPEKTFIKASIDLRSSRIFLIAGKLCTKNPLLLSGLDITKEGWQELLLESVNQGKEIWEGISKPQLTLYQIVDHLIAGHHVNKALLREISVSHQNDLKEFPNRQKVWDLLPENSKRNFLQATALSCVKSLIKGELSLKTLEEPLLAHIQSSDFIRVVLRTDDITVSSKLSLFDEMPGLGDNEAKYLIDNNRFSSIDSTILGEKIRKKNWSSVANHCFSLNFRRSDLKSALEQCLPMFNFFQRIRLSISGFSGSTITSVEYWDALLEKATDLYPYGPDQNGLWELAGGHNKELINGVSGKERWGDALHIVRSGGKPTRQSLIRAMLIEFPNDEILKFLQRIV